MILRQQPVEGAVSPACGWDLWVADPDLIDETRALRRLIYRHPPTNIQYQMAHFLAQGTMKPTCAATTLTRPALGRAAE